MCDIGSGAGFPGIPLKILHPDLNLVIIEPTMKRAKFLAALTEVLGLKGVEIINGRAEDVAGSYRESFPAVTARAVARLPVLLELAMPYVQVGGFFLAMKGASYREEALEAESALKILDSEIVEEHQYSLNRTITADQGDSQDSQKTKQPRNLPRKICRNQKKTPIAF